MLSYPRPIYRIQQIEVTTFCDLRCVYCPSRKLEKVRGQEKMHMELETFEKALVWCQHYERSGVQGELSLTGIGETLLHPQLFELIPMARRALPHNEINFSTNGLKLTDEVCGLLKEYKIDLFVSLHRPEKAGPAIEKAKKAGLRVGVNAGASVAAFDWAGEVDYFVSADRGLCEWLGKGWANVLVDGRLTVCCLDAAGKGVFAHVDDTHLMDTPLLQPFSLCSTCHMQVPEEKDLIEV